MSNATFLFQTGEKPGEGERERERERERHSGER